MGEYIMLCIDFNYVKKNDSSWCSQPPVAHGKCQEFVEETRRLITKEVDCMPDAKISAISLQC